MLPTQNEGLVNIPRIVAQFISVYGNDTFKDGRIHWKYFWLLHEQLGSVHAVSRVETASAVSLGVGMVMGDSNSAKRVLQQSVEETKVIA